MVNKRQVFVSIQSQSSIRSADELQAALNSGRSFISTNMRPGSSVSGGSSAGAPHDEKPKRKRQRLDHLTQDEKVMRRKMKNRMAAQTARDRKKVKMTDLEVEVNRLASNNEQLVKQNMALKQRLAALTTENTRMRSKLEELGHEDVESVTPNLVGILNEVQEDLDLDEILKPFMADGDCSDISSDDSGYLFSDYSGSNLNADSGSLKIKAGNANVVTGTQNSLTSSIDLDDKDALESAVFISDPQQQEQVSMSRVRSDSVMSQDVHSNSSSNSSQDPLHGVRTLIRLIESELVNPEKEKQQQQQRQQAAIQQSKANQSTISSNGHLKIFLIILHLLSLQGMLPKSIRSSSKSSLRTALLRAWNALLPPNQDSMILESLLKTAHENLTHSVRCLENRLTPIQEPNIILERFLKTVLDQRTKSDNVQQSSEMTSEVAANDT